jgi:hypothetical protein
MAEAQGTESSMTLRPDTRPLVTELRELLATRLGHALHRMMEKVDDALFELAEKSENMQSQSLYFDAMREVRLKRASIEEGFRAHFRQSFDARVAGTGDAAQGGPDGSTPLAWGLVDDEAVEEQIAVNNLADKVSHGCREELYALDQRLRALLAAGADSTWTQPVTPELVCEAIRRAVADLQSGLKIRLIILKLFDRYVAAELAVIYHDCNEWLIGKGILPELRTELRHPRHARALAPRAGAATAGGGMAQMDDASLLTALRGLLLGEDAGAGASMMHAGGRVALTGSLDGLTALQRGDGASWSEAVEGGVAWAEGLRGEVNVLRSLKGSELTRAFGPTGELTIDIVAMLFDYILDDRSIPSALRALIGRLQIPIVKVALLDTTFFSRKSHPARRLLNTLAEAAAGSAAAADDSDPLHATMERLVTRVNREFEQDIAVFAEVLESFERFLVEEGERRMLRGERTRKVIGAQPGSMDLAEEVARVVDARTSGTALNGSVRDFLQGWWRSVLHALALQQGIAADPFREAVQTMDDLIASVAPKHTPEERRRLSTTLPALLARLKAGMERIEVPVAARKRFLAELARVHSDAVRGRDTTLTAVAVAAAPAVIPTEPEQPVDLSIVDADARECETVERMHSPLRSPAPAEAGAAIAAGVETEAEAEAAATPVGRGTGVTPLESAARPPRPRAEETTGQATTGGTPAPVVLLRRPTGEAPAITGRAAATAELAASIEVPAEYAERTSPREQLADVLRNRLLQTGEVPLSELIDSTLIEERLARTQPLEPTAAPGPESLLERTLPESGPASRTEASGALSASEIMALMASGAVAFEEVTLADPAAPQPEQAVGEDEHGPRVAALETGTWIEFTEEDGSRRQARLTWINSATDTFMFTDRRGLKVADRTRNGLIADFRRGSARVLEQGGGFDNWMGKLMDGLGRAMQR